MGRDTLGLRFWNKVRKGPDCWEWTGDATKAGYGLVWRGRGIPKLYAHRVSYSAYWGEIPDGAEVMHLCDNPSCVRPSHLRAGTHAENMRDARVKGRLAKGKRHGMAKLTEEQAQRIRRLRIEGVPGVEVARCFGVSQQAVCDIFKGRNWSWL